MNNTEHNLDTHITLASTFSLVLFQSSRQLHFLLFNRLNGFPKVVLQIISHQTYKKVSSYTEQYLLFWAVQSALHFTSPTDLFNQTPSQLLWETSSHMLQLMRGGSYIVYQPLSIARYTIMQLRKLEQCRVNKTRPRV